MKLPFVATVNIAFYSGVGNCKVLWDMLLFGAF